MLASQSRCEFQSSSTGSWANNCPGMSLGVSPKGWPSWFPYENWTQLHATVFPYIIIILNIKGTVVIIANMFQPRLHIKNQRHYFANKGPSSQGYGFSSGHVWMWELDYEESRAPENWCFWNVVLEKTLESPLDCKEIQPVHPKGDQSWVFIGRTDAEAETPVLWLQHEKSWLTGKDPDAGRDWGQEEKGATEDEIVGWHHWLDGHESE